MTIIRRPLLYGRAHVRVLRGAAIERSSRGVGIPVCQRYQSVRRHYRTERLGKVAHPERCFPAFSNRPRQSPCARDRRRGLACGFQAALAQWTAHSG